MPSADGITWSTVVISETSTDKYKDPNYDPNVLVCRSYDCLPAELLAPWCGFLMMNIA